jgi:glucosylceramidase
MQRPTGRTITWIQAQLLAEDRKRTITESELASTKQQSNTSFAAMAALVVLLAGATTVSAQFGSQYASPWSYSQASPPVQITVNANMRYQTMTGGGCSGAFGVACDQTGGGLSPATQQEISDYLFSENLGGLSILRNRIGSGTNDGYLASCPSSPSATFNYTFGTNNATADSCQLRLSQQALISNPNLQIYADAWSANYCFKSASFCL